MPCFDGDGLDAFGRHGRSVVVRALSRKTIEGYGERFFHRLFQLAISQGRAFLRAWLRTLVGLYGVASDPARRGHAESFARGRVCKDKLHALLQGRQRGRRGCGGARFSRDGHDRKNWQVGGEGSVPHLGKVGSRRVEGLAVGSPAR